MPNLNNNNNAIKETLKVVKDFQEIEKEYGRETLIDVFESVGGFFGLINLVYPEAVDKEDAKKYIEEQKPVVESRESVQKPGPYESDDISSFGLYRELMEKKGESKIDPQLASIYSQDPKTLAKVEEDRINHQTMKEDSKDREPFDDSTEEVKPLTKALEYNNPWSEVGSPVSPGQIKF